MRTSVRTHPTATETVVNVLTQTAAGQQVTARIMKGLVRLETILNKEDRTLRERSIVKKMRERFHTFEPVLHAITQPSHHADVNALARALAKTIAIRIKP